MLHYHRNIFRVNKFIRKIFSQNISELHCSHKVFFFFKHVPCLRFKGAPIKSPKKQMQLFTILNALKRERKNEDILGPKDLEVISKIPNALNRDVF